jgi:hypothetical protein
MTSIANTGQPLSAGDLRARQGTMSKLWRVART